MAAQELWPLVHAFPHHSSLDAPPTGIITPFLPRNGGAPPLRAGPAPLPFSTWASPWTSSLISVLFLSGTQEAAVAQSLWTLPMGSL